jgi:hypothetical protein
MTVGPRPMHDFPQPELEGRISMAIQPLTTFISEKIRSYFHHEYRLGDFSFGGR